MGVLEKYGTLLGKGLVIEFAPDVLRCTLLELFAIRKVNVAKATNWVNANTNLWTMLGSEYQNYLKRLGKELPNLDWITSDWVIEAIKGDYPGVASLFLGWRKASNWLERQINQIKTEIKSPSS